MFSSNWHLKASEWHGQIRRSLARLVKNGPKTCFAISMMTINISISSSGAQYAQLMVRTVLEVYHI